MDNITECMHAHHQHCDEAFVNAEEAVQRKDWSGCAAAFEKFRLALEAHFGAEEGIIFPAFESRSGMFGGPTQVMRGEHSQMRGLLNQMQAAMQANDADAFAGAAGTLLVMMQQHNMKEENILYPMCDQVLGADDKLLGEVAGALAAA